VPRRRYEVTEIYALIDISKQMLEDSAFDMEGKIRGRALSTSAHPAPYRAADAEEWARLFEISEGRFPLPVAHLQGRDAFCCDWLRLCGTISAGRAVRLPLPMI